MLITMMSYATNNWPKALSCTSKSVGVIDVKAFHIQTKKVFLAMHHNADLH